MEIKAKKKTFEGVEKEVKVQTPSLERIINAVKQRGLFHEFTRYRYGLNDIEGQLKLVEAIGKARNTGFVIDKDNRFTYENFIKWCWGDETFKCIRPDTKQIVPGNLRKGIYIAGNTGSGKSWCLEIMQAYSLGMNFGISFDDDVKPRPLYWYNRRADEICDSYVKDGSIIGCKEMPMLGIQDLGQEPAECLFMGNRLDVIRNLIEYRGDRPDQITFITSNMSMNGNNLIQRYGDRVASRLMEMCNYFEMKGKDRRDEWNHGQ